ncbi:MAG TPA: polyhydroxyalkanoic acid system protein [Porticoccaceae bacterium]|nr:polyhydroxyalkanoic acid system protein [Porticoccaceae bacterium]HCO60515.1 polyhydroxyalkanoic acid system protein [Porticoccaceae bacterium]
MAKIRVQRDHQLSLDTVRETADELADQLRKRFGGSYGWQGDELSYKRSGVDARIICSKQDIVVDVKLKGLMMSALRGTIESEIKTSLDKYLA